MSERLWIPSAYVDETAPPGRASPDAWIGAPAGDVWILAPWDEDEEPDTTLAPGQVVEFEWVERLGAVEVEIRADGTAAPRSPVPPGANNFMLEGDPDTIADSLEAFAAQWRPQDFRADADRIMTVLVARWSDVDERFQFVVDDRGPRFIRAAPGGRATS